MRIIVDAMSGDNAPLANVKGAILASKEFNTDIILVGKEAILKPMLAELGCDTKKISIMNATDIITMEDNPSSVIREKPDASMLVALRALADGAGDAVVSSGNTGALLTGATLLVRRLPNIRRCALSALIPTKKGRALLVDCGANTNCTPEYLLQFAIMGSVYMNKYMKIHNPTVGLLNNGSEEKKGTELYVQTHSLLKNSKDKINFIGNIEGREALQGGSDIIVCDGFTGNIMLKTIEGVGSLVGSMVKDMFTKNMFTKISALMVSSGIGNIKKMMDYKETGGAPLLGIAKPVIKAHGGSDEIAIRGAINQAIIFAESGVNDEIITKIKAINMGEV